MKLQPEWAAYLATLESKLGEGLAREFVESLHQKYGGCPRMALRFFHNLGMTWAPVIKAWSAWVQTHAEVGTIAIILHDAKPLVMLEETKTWTQLYLNRPTCGIKDELSQDAAKTSHSLLHKYLRQHACDEPFTFVDSGCYGSIVLALHQMGISFQPLFFFSKNPNIPGFLNDLDVSEEEGTILNDSLECGFPHHYRRTENLIETNGTVHVILEETDRLSMQFSLAALCGVGMGSLSKTRNLRTSVEHLLALSRQARAGTFTGILSHESPEWSEKEKFLANWPKDLRWT